MCYILDVVPDPDIKMPSTSWEVHSCVVWLYGLNMQTWKFHSYKNIEGFFFLCMAVDTFIKLICDVHCRVLTSTGAKKNNVKKKKIREMSVN